MAIAPPENILNQIKISTGQGLGVPWENDFKTLASQLQSIQSQADIYKGGSPLEASQHIYNIASTLARDYGIGSIADIGVRQVPNDAISEVREGVGESERISYEPVGGTKNEYFNKKDPAKIIPAQKFASEGAGEGYSNYSLEAVPDGKGGMIAVPVQQYSLSGATEFIADNKNLIMVAAVALQVVPGLGQTVGYAVLGAGDVIAGAALAGEIAAGVGISTVTAASVVTAVGSATIAASVTAAQGGTVEDVLKAGAAAGSAVGINFAAGGGVTGAAAGSAVGTAIQGGNAEQVLVNAFAAGVGAGVQDAMPNNPKAGKILGDAARTYISTGGDIDKTLLNTTATAIGTLDQKPTTAPNKLKTAEEQLTDQILAESPNIGTSVEGIGGEMADTLAGMMSTPKPEISNINDFKTFVDEELLKSQFDPTAQAQPLINQAGRVIGPAVGAAGRVLIPVAEEVVMPAAMRFAANNPQYAAETAQYLSKMGMTAAAASVVTSFGLSSDTINLPSAQLQGLINQIPRSNLPVVKPETFDPGTGAGWDSTKTKTIPTKVTTSTGRVVDTGDESARLLARFPAPGSAPASNLNVIGEAEGDPIYTRLTTAINSGVDPYIVIEQMIGAAKGYGVDPSSYLDDIVDAAGSVGLNPQRTVQSAVNAMYEDPETEVYPGINPSVKPAVDPITRPDANPATDPAINPSINPSINPNINPNTNPNINPNINPRIDPSINPKIDPRVDPKIDPKLDPAIDPRINPKVDPKLDPVPDPILDLIKDTIKTDPVIGDPVVDKPVVDEPIVDEPVVDDPVVGEPVVDDPVVGEPPPPPPPPPPPDEEPPPPTDLPPDVVSEPPPGPEKKEEKEEEPEEKPNKEEEPEEKPKKETKRLYPTVTQTPRPKRTSYPTLAGPSPARLLADALSAYRPAGEIEGGESGKERQNVWNEKSLRLKDALGL